jgi:hypothetical protein
MTAGGSLVVLSVCPSRRREPVPGKRAIKREVVLDALRELGERAGGAGSFAQDVAGVVKLPAREVAGVMRASGEVFILRSGAGPALYFFVGKFRGHGGVELGLVRVPREPGASLIPRGTGDASLLERARREASPEASLGAARRREVAGVADAGATTRPPEIAGAASSEASGDAGRPSLGTRRDARSSGVARASER